MDWEHLLKQYKTNRTVQVAVLAVLLLLAYIFPGNAFFNMLFACLGLALGRLSFNDDVDSLDI